MATVFPGNTYASPGVYPRTLFENPVAGVLSAVKIPLLIGTGNEILFQQDLEVVRGSSSSVDQEVPQEDMEGRAVKEITATGQVVLSNFDGILNRVQVRNYPIVRGDGSGSTTNDRSRVTVTINGDPVVVLSLDGARGIITLAQEPLPGDDVRVTYFFNRTDTLITDDLSNQVTADPAILRGEIGVALGDTYAIVPGIQDQLILTVDRESELTVIFPEGDFSPSQIAALINGQAVGTLVASVYQDNNGNFAIQLTAQEDLSMGSGSANDLFGFTAGTSTSRNRIFYTFQGPIVTGNNGGVTSTNPADVTVSVDNTAVVATAVDGANRAVTLPFAPPVGSTVKVTYYFNSWQDTFDYLANIGITDILRVGITAGRNDYIDGVDFILADDKIVWGTAALVSSGTTTVGATIFGSSQISTTLVDNKAFLELCEPVVNTNVSPAVDSRRLFRLPFVPTTGNGRNTPLGESLFSSVSNNRIDLPTNRPDLVVAYWGFSVQDALDRGPVTVNKVDSSTATIELKYPIDPGASVWATFYYNTLEDNEYTLEVVVPGSATVGTYRVEDKNGTPLYDVNFGTKSAGLTGITVQFPSGSENFPDARIEANPFSEDFEGAVEEVVTVTFRDSPDTPAKFTVAGHDPYYPIDGASDKVRLLVDGADLVTGATGLDLSDPTGLGTGFFALLLGDEVVYDAPSGGITYDIDANNLDFSLLVDGVLLTAAVPGPLFGASIVNYVSALNLASVAVGFEPEYHGATKFTSPLTITANEYDQLTLHYTGSIGGLSGNQTITLTPGAYNSVVDLVSEINTQLATINGLGFLAGTVVCAANASGQLVFNLTLAAADAGTRGYLEFVANASPARDFAILAGLDTDAATAGSQVKLMAGTIADTYTTPVIGERKHDRIAINNRLVPGSGSLSPFSSVSQTQLQIVGAPDHDLSGFDSGDYALAGFHATVQPATLLGEVGFASGQATGFADARDSQPVVVFYDGTGTESQNNVFKFTMDGVPVTVVFTASGAGTATPVGPGSIAGTVLEQIAAAMAIAGFGANAAAVIAAGLIWQEGAGIRLVSSRVDQFSSIEIGTASANDDLGFSDGASDLRDPVDVRTVASALMAQSQATVALYLTLEPLSALATYFAAEALASVAKDELGQEFIYLQSQSVGVSSSIIWGTATADDALAIGTGFLNVAGDGALGEAGIAGFFVTSSDPSDGSGTLNTSVFNVGVGQDGIVGQTYRDDITGLTFTVLPREGGFSYPSNESFTFKVSRNFVTNSNIPTRAIPGVEMLVTNTVGTVVGDTAIVSTYERGGSEPAVGDLYNVTYAYRKQDFSTQLYTRLRVIEENYGPRNPQNPVTLASYLLFINGGVVVAIQQVEKDEGSDFANINKYIDALDDLVKPLSGGLLPDILVPLEGGSVDFFKLLSIHCDVQSSIRYRQERTAIIGLRPVVNPTDAGSIAQQISNQRIRMVYPDSALVSITDALSNVDQFFVEGFYLASALAGSVASPSLDVATPWTNRVLFGFDRLGRNLDIQQMNELAVQGVTVLDERDPNIFVRHGLTTDISDVLTRTPTIRLIADEIHIRSRAILNRFIGVKFLPGILTEIEGALTALLTDLVRGQIITAFTGVRANVTADPTTAEVEAFYQPVFPLLYLILTFHLRSQLQ